LLLAIGGMTTAATPNLKAFFASDFTDTGYQQKTFEKVGMAWKRPAEMPEVDKECFDNPEFRITFSAISNLVSRNEKINIISVKAELQSLGNPLSLDDLSNIDNKYLELENFDTLIEILIDRKNRRNSLEKLKIIFNKLRNDTTPYNDIIREVGDLIIDNKNTEDKFVKAGEYIKFRERSLIQERSIDPIMTGYYELDEQITYKLPGGEVSVIGARPQNGKSTFKSNLIKNICNSGIGVCSFALEQTLKVESDRMDSIISGLSLKEDILTMGNWLDTDPRWKKIREAWEIQNNWNYHLVEANGKSVSELKNIIRMLSQQGVRIFFFDLFDREKEVGDNPANKAQRTSSVLNRHLEIAKEFNVHLCLLVQINREAVKNKTDIRPKLHHLKDSGAYEEYARLILLLHYPKAHDESLVSSNIEIRVAKQSNGPLFTQEFGFTPENFQIHGRVKNQIQFKRS